MRMIMLCMLAIPLCALAGQDLQQGPPPPDGFLELLFDLVRQMITPNIGWVIIALFVGLLAAVGGAEYLKRWDKLFPEGGETKLRAQLYASLWGSVTTGLLIFGLTTWGTKGQVIAIVCIAPLSAFWSGKAYDVLWTMFPILMDRATRKLRGDEPPPTS